MLFKIWIPAVLALLLTSRLTAARISGYSEFVRPDPFGGIVSVDQTANVRADDGQKSQETISLKAARNGYASFHLAVELPEGGSYSLGLKLAGPPDTLKADLFKAWFHLNRADKHYYPDALIPVSNPYSSSIPDPDNQIPKQKVALFWVDFWIPRQTAPATYRGEAILRSTGSERRLKIELKVLPVILPDEDVLAVDHNSYGTSWMGELYPKLKQAERGNFYASDALFSLIHSYHRLFYEHHGVFHQLGYGHGGKVGPEFAPALEGEGRNKHVASWDLFDRHYGPLLDGSAFASSRRGAKAIPFAYLPINPEWPASFLWWGEPGYEVEFTNVLREMERHFRDKGWTSTRFEIFFNHKKRYKAFPWDGDETKFLKDLSFFEAYGRWIRQAIPAQSPVRFVFRSDSSWSLEQQFEALAGIVNFWVCSQDILSWLPASLRRAKERGDIVWTYSGPPSISQPSSAILHNPLRAWVWGVDGYVHWLTVSPSRDPWFQSEGESTCLAYPGEKFGLNEPIPSIRLKIQRNFIQDLNLLKLLERNRSPQSLRQEITRRVNGTTPQQWWTPRPAIAEVSPEEWSNDSIDGAARLTMHALQKLDAHFWEPVRTYILDLAEGVPQ